MFSIVRRPHGVSEIRTTNTGQFMGYVLDVRTTDTIQFVPACAIIRGIWPFASSIKSRS